MLSKELDKFYTNADVAAFCADIFAKYKLEGPTVEPSAGSGAFAPWSNIMFDLLPEGPNITQANFLTVNSTQYKNYLGNPPFGKNSSLAKKFFNHAACGQGVIGFILPRTFRKISIQNALNMNFHLVEDVLLSPNSFTLNGKPYAVPCVFQVWVWKPVKRQKVVLPTSHPDFSFVKPTECDFSIRRVGGNAGVVNDHNNYAEASNYFIRGPVKDIFIELESEFKEAAINTAGNPSLSKSELIYIYERRR